MVLMVEAHFRDFNMHCEFPSATKSLFGELHFSFSIFLGFTFLTVHSIHATILGSGFDFPAIFLKKENSINKNVTFI